MARSFFLLLLFSLAWGQNLELAKLLQQGGYVIYFRHAETDQSQSSLELANAGRIPGNYDDCSLQRNLDERGRRQAGQIGEAFRKLAIPVGDVFASPYCRCRDTAVLAFGKQTRSDLLLGVGITESALTRNLPAFGQLLSTAPAKNTNTILVAHLGPLNYLTKKEIELEQGEAAIFKPLGEQGFTLVARVKAEEWLKLNNP